MLNKQISLHNFWQKVTLIWIYNCLTCKKTQLLKICRSHKYYFK